MASRVSLQELVQRATQANVRYVEGLGRVWSDYLGALGGVLRELTATVKLPFAESLKRPPAAAGPALVLEAPAGSKARAAFMVDNRLSRQVTAPVVASPLTDAAGAAIDASVEIEPTSIVLAPGGNALVQVAVAVTEAFHLGASYRAEISVPGLAERSIPVLVRRIQAAGPG